MKAEEEEAELENLRPELAEVCAADTTARAAVERDEAVRAKDDATMEDGHKLNSPADGAMGRHGRRGSIPAPAFTGDKGATAGGRASAGNTGQAHADGSPKPALVGANGVAATPKGSARRVLFSDEVQAGAGAATPNLLAQGLASPGMGRAEPANLDFACVNCGDSSKRKKQQPGLCNACGLPFALNGKDPRPVLITPAAEAATSIAPDPIAPDPTEEEQSLRDLTERVLEETGLTLTDGWTVSIELEPWYHGSGKTTRRTRFYSPGGRRFRSAGEVIADLVKKQKNAKVTTIDGVLPGAAVNESAAVKAVDAELWTSPRGKSKSPQDEVLDELEAAAAAIAAAEAVAAAEAAAAAIIACEGGNTAETAEAIAAGDDSNHSDCSSEDVSDEAYVKRHTPRGVRLLRELTQWGPIGMGADGSTRGFGRVRPFVNDRLTTVGVGNVWGKVHDTLDDHGVPFPSSFFEALAGATVDQISSRGMFASRVFLHDAFVRTSRGLMNDVLSAEPGSEAREAAMKELLLFASSLQERVVANKDKRYSGCHGVKSVQPPPISTRWDSPPSADEHIEMNAWEAGLPKVRRRHDIGVIDASADLFGEGQTSATIEYGDMQPPEGVLGSRVKALNELKMTPKGVSGVGVWENVGLVSMHFMTGGDNNRRWLDTSTITHQSKIMFEAVMDAWGQGPYVSGGDLNFVVLGVGGIRLLSRYTGYEDSHCAKPPPRTLQLNFPYERSGDRSNRSALLLQAMRTNSCGDLADVIENQLKAGGVAIQLLFYASELTGRIHQDGAGVVADTVPPVAANVALTLWTADGEQSVFGFYPASVRSIQAKGFDRDAREEAACAEFHRTPGCGAVLNSWSYNISHGVIPDVAHGVSVTSPQMSLAMRIHESDDGLSIMERLRRGGAVCFYDAAAAAAGGSDEAADELDEILVMSQETEKLSISQDG